MGAAGLLATLSGRRASRLYALGLALMVTVAISPGVAGNVGWQLSFAAVLGILLLAAPLREWLVARVGSGGWRRVLAEGIAVTVAATLATALGSVGSGSVQNPSPPNRFSHRELVMPPGYDESPTHELLSCRPP